MISKLNYSKINLFKLHNLKDKLNKIKMLLKINKIMHSNICNQEFQITKLKFKMIIPNKEQVTSYSNLT